MNWNGNTQSGVNNCWQNMPTNAPNTIPNAIPNYLTPGTLGFGMDPNPNFTAAINRLAAAFEKFNER